MSAHRVSLATIATIEQGGRHGLSGNHFVRAEDGYPAFGAGGLNGYLSTYEFEEAAIVLSAIGARCGKCFLPSGKWSSLANTQIIRPDRSRADVRFLWYQLNDENSWRRSGTAQPFIKPSTVKTREVVLPPLSEQRRIADILDKADAIRRKRKQAIALTEDLLRSAFLDMFGDPVTNPKGWPVRPLGECCEMETGFPFSSPRFSDHGIRLCRGANVLPGAIDWSDVRHWADGEVVQERYHLRAGDVVLAMDRPWISTGLKLAIVAKGDVPSYLVQRVARLRATRRLTNEYVYFSLLHPAFARHCAAHMTETTVPHISPHDVRSYEVPIPDAGHLQRFAHAFEKMTSLVTYAECQSRFADSLFASLVDSIFSVQAGAEEGC